MTLIGRSLSLGAILALGTTAAHAVGTVTVSSIDGAVTITGTLTDHDEETLYLETVIGTLSLERRAVTCEGESCPAAPEGLSMNVALADPALAGLLQRMTDAFASDLGMVAMSVAGEAGVPRRIEVISGLEGDAGVSGIEVASLDPVGGFEALLQGRADLTLTPLSVPPAAAERYAAAGNTDLRDERRERVIALDAVVPVVHPDNPVRSISVPELALIVAGRITNWSELGGEDRPIRRILPERDSALDISLAQLVLAPNRVRLRRRGIERMTSEAEAIAAVMADPGAITVSGLAATAEAAEAKVVPIRQVCGPLANATDFTVKAEEYPLSRRILGYTGADAYGGNEGAFLDYMVSEAAQPIVAGLGFVDQTIVAEPVGGQGTRMTSAILTAGDGAGLGLVQDFVSDLATADRLSTTFRFQSGSSRLDTKAIDDVARMVEYLQTPEARLREVMVIGFTDNVGRYDLNTELAERRAERVRDALLEAPGGDALTARITTSSYGPLAPVGCNETAEGRDSNRRVEIWLR